MTSKVQRVLTAPKTRAFLETLFTFAILATAICSVKIMFSSEQDILNQYKNSGIDTFVYFCKYVRQFAWIFAVAFAILYFCCSGQKKQVFGGIAIGCLVGWILGIFCAANDGEYLKATINQIMKAIGGDDATLLE